MESRKHGQSAGQKRKVTEEAVRAVRKSEEKFRDLIENIYDWVWESDRDLVITYSNPRVLDYLGYAPEEVVGKSLYGFMGPEMVKRISTLLDAIARQRKHFAVAEKTLISRQGEPVPFEMTITMIFSEDGVLRGYRGICRDIRDRRRAEAAQQRAYGELEKRVKERTEELVYARATLQGILDTAPIGIIVADAETSRITYCSEGAKKLFGGPVTGTIYGPKKGTFQLLRPDGSPLTNEEKPLIVSLKTGKPVWNREILVKRADGSELTILVSTAPIKNPDGRITAVVGTTVDITRLKSTEKELQETKGQVEMYLDLMGHDINNLNQIGIGYLELALDRFRARGRLDPDDQLLLDKAMETQVSSSRLIENVRKIQRSRPGGLTYYPVDLCQVLERLKEYFTHVPHREVVIRAFLEKHCFVNANDLIADIFSNLIDNAIKHSSPDKCLRIDVALERIIIDGRDYYAVSIEDNGPGIPDELKGRLFTRFQRGMTKTSGRGLGLYLARTILDDYNGKIMVEDRVRGDFSQGSRFVVLLPVASSMPQTGVEACRG
jgi:PAS domain S-box-containing protein